MGPGSRASWPGNVFPTPEVQVGSVSPPLQDLQPSGVGAGLAPPAATNNSHVKKSRTRYHAPARGSAQVLPLRNPNGAAGNLMPSNGMSFGSPQISPASFAPNQVAAATPCPAKPAAKYMPSSFPACGITSRVKSSVPPQMNSTLVSRSWG